MALDELKDTDNLYEVDGFKYIVDKEFMEKSKPIKVDFNHFGFKLTSGIDLGAGCSSCSTTGSCCS
ncbi:MAG: hypothetical protein ISS67_00225 [Desulfobacterales bacterium]|uniref:Uncharacterized protein n=1 Tax=Candidatus Desulfaltia bathyphila TaxID=2841697 RepID=A0A8J6N4M4_9BACT|nr:hypothetical protein [Candidatus Desulfaltia bathyphila]MBL7194829.1 hypothetical protein [Desulfobacterales bacterium]MBL7206939.1 hypothetical protein [Desulfobacterales bacterium]